jgi:hypothetical protein
MYTPDLPIFVSRKVSAESIFPVSIQIMFAHFLLRCLKRDADRFLLWWLFLHRRLRSRQRGSVCRSNPSDIATFRLYLPKGVVCFYPNNLKSPKTFR